MSQIQKALIQQYAKTAGEFLCEQTISTLESIPPPFFSAGESRLENTWERICAQVEGGESFFSGGLIKIQFLKLLFL